LVRHEERAEWQRLGLTGFALHLHLPAVERVPTFAQLRCYPLYW